jgi:PadR family transcriptional regulator PadR
MGESLPLVKGTLDVLVLKALNLGPMHGFEVTTWLESRSGGAIGVDDSALYQSLYRLEERGFISAEWGVTENNRRARYYRMKPAGKAFLREQTEHWLKYSKAVTGVLTWEPRRST